MVNGSKPQPQTFLRDNLYNPPVATLKIEVWADGSAKALVDDVDLVNFIKSMRVANRSVERIVKMLREAAVIIESGIV